MPQQTRTRIDGEVTHYPSRTAMVRNVILSGPSSHYADLWQTLADSAGVEPDNHQAFAVSHHVDGALYVLFSDDMAYFGTNIEVMNW